MEDKPEGTVLVLLDIYSKTIYTLHNFPVNIGKQQGLGGVAGRQIVTLKQGILNLSLNLLIRSVQWLDILCMHILLVL